MTDEQKRRRPGKKPSGKAPSMRTPGGLIRKVAYLHADEVAALRRLAYEEARSESDIIREAVRAYLGVED